MKGLFYWKGIYIMKNLLFDNPDLSLSLLAGLMGIFAWLIYRYTVFKLKKITQIQEMKIKKDVIKDTSNHKKENELIENMDYANLENISKILLSDEIYYEGNFLYKLLRLHHEQALQQSNIQFWFSIVASIIGFLFIILMVFITDSIEWYDYVFKMMPGAIIEIVSILFINQARETRDRATKFFTELNYEMQISKSVEIADSIEDEGIKADVKSKIALHIIGIGNEAKK